MEPRIDATLRLPALDGFELAATLYEPAAGAGDGGPVVLINSATAVRRGYYDGYARALAAQGFSVLTWDYRGIGDSRPRSLAGFRARMRQWGEVDLAGILGWIADHLRPRRLLVVGHSVGGQLVGLAANNHRIHALMMVGSQNGWWGHWPAPSRYRIALNWFVLIPLVTRVYGYLPGRFGTKEDLPPASPASGRAGGGGGPISWSRMSCAPDSSASASRSSPTASPTTTLPRAPRSRGCSTSTPKPMFIIATSRRETWAPTRSATSASSATGSGTASGGIRRRGCSGRFSPPPLRPSLAERERAPRPARSLSCPSANGWLNAKLPTESGE